MSSSKSLKRSRPQDETDTRIKTAEGEPLPAKSSLLRTFSSVAEELPAGTAEWDVGGLLYKGQPFTQATVQCWLSCAYSVLYGPAELDADDKAQLSTAKGLHAVLAFAHAVGAPPALCTAACSQLDSLQIVVQLPEQTLELRVSGQHSYYIDSTTRELRRELPERRIGQPVTAQQQEQAQVQQQVAEQTGELLHMAHVLWLQPLINALHTFIFFNYRYNDSVLWGVLELVFSAATIDAALGSSTISKETYIESVLTRPCGFVAGKFGNMPMFKPAGEITSDKTGVQAFDADVLESFAGLSVGERVRVKVNLFGQECTDLVITRPNAAGAIHFPAQLMLGFPITGARARQQLMSSKLPQP